MASTTSTKPAAAQHRSFSLISSCSVPAAILTNSCLVPFDVLKIRLQKQSMSKINDSISSTAIRIYKTEGIRSLFNGYTFSVLHSVGLNLSMLLCYDRFRAFIGNNITKNVVYQPLLTSAASTSIATFVTFPLEYWKTIQQSSKEAKISFQFNRMMYAAFVVCLQRNVGFFMTFWPINENFKRFATQYFDPKQSNARHFILNWTSGIISAAVAGSLTQPFDVVKTRMQIDKEYSLRSSGSILKEIYTTQGFKALFVGIQPRFVKTLFYGSMFFSFYEHFVRVSQAYLAH